MAAKETPLEAPPPPPPPSEHARREGALAFRNAVKLFASLSLTWGVALIVTFKLPKYLGDRMYGHYQVGESTAMTAAVFLSLGVDTYISREIAVRPKHASDFFGGVLVVRALSLLPIALGAALFLRGEVWERQLATILFGFAYLFTALNQTFQQTLQAASTVGRLAVANVVAKIMWGGGVYTAVVLGAPFWVLPLPMVASELLKAIVLFGAVRSAVDLEIRVDMAETKRVLAVAFPFFIANVAVSVGSSVDVLVLAKIANAEEVGWYSAARRIAQLSALLSPVLSGVLIPMMSRAKARSDDEFFAILRRGVEGVNVVSIPFTLLLAIGAPFWVHIALKDAFLPSAESLRWLAPTFVLSYMNVLLWLSLMILDRSWTITIISVAGLVLLPPFVLVVVPLTRHLGPGGAGMGAAMAMTARELVIVMVFLFFLGKRALDRRAILNILKSLLLCAAVIALHARLAQIGPVRLFVDAVAYGVGMLALGVVRPRDVKAVLKLVKDRKRPQPA